MQTKLQKNKSGNWLALAALLAGLHHAPAATVSIGWSQSSDTNVIGYNIYYGTTSGNYTSKVTAGNVSAVTISNLTAGATYYFVATDFDAKGDESAFSQQIPFIVPGVLTLSPGANPGDPLVIKFPVAPAHWYEVQASVDLSSWTTIWQTAVESSNSWIQFSDPAASAFPSRYYRLVLH
jgi:hypothetical protein